MKKYNIVKQFLVAAACICLGGVLGGTSSEAYILGDESVYDTNFITSTNGKYQYEIVDEQEKTVTIRKILTEAEKVTVPETIDGYEVIGVGMIKDCLDMDDIPAPMEVLSLGEAGQHTLKRITLPDSLRTIGVCAFYDYDMLQRVDFSDTEQIGDYAFCGCKKLKTIELTEGVAYGYKVFSNQGMNKTAKFDKLVLNGMMLDTDDSEIAKRVEVGTLVLNGNEDEQNTKKIYRCDFCMASSYHVKRLVVGKNIEKLYLGIGVNEWVYGFEEIKEMVVTGKKTQIITEFSGRDDDGNKLTLRTDNSVIGKMYVLPKAKAKTFAKKNKIVCKVVNAGKMKKLSSQN